MNIDRALAVRLVELITSGPAVGAGADGQAVYDNTDLGVVLHALGFPTSLERNYVGSGKGDIVKSIKTNDGKPYRSDYKTNTKPMVEFLRAWADALELSDEPDYSDIPF